ncbi:MAG: sulfite exporter TauE/SafE family protein [Deltaproteobacteria bacterium]|nr:sulfite exporter TauE/SafE family protein [Deltaproteobacteria bacterium]
MVETMIAAFAGMCAGVLNGLNGNSAFGIIPPVLILFLRIDPYAAIGISLATDVVSSAVSAGSYFRGGHIRIKTVYPMAIAAAVGTLIGSFVSQYIPSGKLGESSGILTILIGVSFLRKPSLKFFENLKKKLLSGPSEKQTRLSVVLCIFIGIVCGIIGFGGGRMIFIILMAVLGLPIHAAVGTAVSIMFFSALSGTVGHILLGRIAWMVLLTCCAGAALGAALSSRFAALTSDKILMKLTGFIFIALGSISFVHQIIRGGTP